MALLTTSTLPLQQTHQQLPPPPPRGHEPAQLSRWLAHLYHYLNQGRTVSDKTYNDLHRQIEGFNMVGLDADLPTAGFPGRTFHATDTKRLYRDTGSAWQYASLT
jgi:hypothetical protein